MTLIRTQDLAAADLLGLAGRLRSREISACELVCDALAAARHANPGINAYTCLLDESALELAAERDRQAARGEWTGPLHGIPFALKDLTHLAGTPNTRGSRLYADAPCSTESAPVVERLLAAGAVPIGKTTTTEFGWKASSTGPLHGVTRNPRDLSRTTGGSSCGSAAALAAGTVPLAIGSDGGGSVRIPAAFCGIFAMKGSLGRIPTWPWSATETLSHIGPMTRNARDSALAFDVLKGPHWRDPQSLPADAARYLDQAALPLKPGLRVAYAPTLFGCPVDPQVHAVVEAAVATLRERLGLAIEVVELPWIDPYPAFEGLWTIGRGVVYGGDVGSHVDQLDPGFARLIEASRGSQPRHLLAAMSARADFCRTAARQFLEIDILLMPTVPILPFAAEDDGPAGWDSASGPVAWGRWTPFTYPFNLTGQPAASMPCGSSAEGLPIGLQVVGARHDDAGVLQFCCAAEQALAD